MVSKKELAMTQLIIAPFDNRQGDRTYLLYGLSADGKVYRHNRFRHGWIACNMRELDADEDED